jgi:molybdate transport system substrate-binding protein
MFLATAFLFVGACGGDDDSTTARNDGGGGQGGPASTTVTTAPQDPNTITLFTVDSLENPVQTLADTFMYLNPGTTVNVLAGQSKTMRGRILDGEVPNVYIDNAGSIQAVGKDVDVAATAPLGSDVLVFIVGRGNPKGITDLKVFGEDANTTSGVCADELWCGKAAGRALKAAAVDPKPDTTENDGANLVKKVAEGQLDAALVSRRDRNKRLAVTTTLQVPDEQRIRVDYEVADIASTPVSQRFVEFVKNAPEAKQVLQRRGLLGLVRKQ